MDFAVGLFIKRKFLSFEPHTNELCDCVRNKQTWRHARSFLCDGLFRYSLIYYLSVECGVDFIEWLHYCELRHAYSVDRLCARHWLHHLRLGLYYVVCDRLHRDGRFAHLSELGCVDFAVGMYHCELWYTYSVDRLCARHWLHNLRLGLYYVVCDRLHRDGRFAHLSELG